MFKYMKTLNYPVNIKRKDLKMAKYLYTQFGGANSELAAALRYFSQKFSMPDEKGKSLLNDIATEELGHVEMIDTMIKQLTANASGVPFSATYFAVTGDPLADISEDMAAEQKARAVYENLIELATDEDVLGVLLFLRQREIVHFNRFKELFKYYKKKGY